MHQTSAGKARRCLDEQVVSVAHKRGPLSFRPGPTHHHPLPVGYMADTIRSHFPVLGIAGETNIHHLKR